MQETELNRVESLIKRFVDDNPEIDTMIDFDVYWFLAYHEYNNLEDLNRRETMHIFSDLIRGTANMSAEPCAESFMQFVDESDPEDVAAYIGGFFK